MVGFSRENEMPYSGIVIDLRSPTNNERFYRDLAKALTEKSRIERWDEDKTTTVTVNGTEYTVGPFEPHETEEYGMDTEILGFGFPDDNFIVVSHTGGFDSWGEWESPYKQEIQFNVAEVVSIRKIYKNIW